MPSFCNSLLLSTTIHSLFTLSCYNQAMKKVAFILCLILSTSAVQATSFAHIPETTLQIAQECTLNENITSTPRSQRIRVAIGNQNFGTYVYSNIGIYGTAEIQIFNNNNLVQNFTPNTNIIVKLQPSSGNYELSTDDGSIIGVYSGVLKFTCSNGLLGVKNLKRASKPALYHGAFEIAQYNSDKFNLVNVIEVEEYLKGVVPNEMPITFGLNALKAQTVSARNYALSPRVKASPNYDVVDSVASQVYFGANTEKELATQAVEETEGVVALYDSELILAQYSSTSGGYTESFSMAFSDPTTKIFPSQEKPYLVAKPDMLTQKPLDNEQDAVEFYKSRPDSYDIRSPYYRWQKQWNGQELRQTLETTLVTQSTTGFVKPAFNKGDKLDDLIEIKVTKRGQSGKIVEMQIVTKTKTFTIQKELVIRRLFVNNGKALPSANVVFECAQDDHGNILSVVAYGGGYGHGVGLSQFGAGFMGSELNMPYEKILQHYYTGITLGTMPLTLTAETGEYIQNFYTTNKETHIIVDNHSQVSKLDAIINGKTITLDIPNSLWGEKSGRINISKYINKGRNTIIFLTPKDTLQGKEKYIKLYVELVKKDDNKYN